jgi:hypothetical protein
MPEVLDSEIYGLRRLPESGSGDPNWRSLFRDLNERISILLIAIASLYTGVSLQTPT